MTVLPPDDDDDELDPSDAALNWDGENDASHDSGVRVGRPSRRVRREKPVAEPDEAEPDEAEPAVAEPVDEDLDAPAPTSSFLLVSYGILAGAFLLYTIGWLTTVLRGTIALADPLGDFMYKLGEFLAIASSPIWFASVFVLTRNSRPIVRLAWLLVGLVVLVPVPFVLGA